ncbi:MAG: Hef nuclease, partial [Candidatus Aenigmarchaeota archaeon]|nr:Hef nuclease [Candidatus Aenigmarchaeota archaeon]
MGTARGDSTPLRDDRVVIYADSREGASHVLAILRNQCTLHEIQLKVGDYLLSKRVVVERKTADDFLQSLVDGRLFRQLEELKNQFEKPLLLLEGNGL